MNRNSFPVPSAFEKEDHATWHARNFGNFSTEAISPMLLKQQLAASRKIELRMPSRSLSHVWIDATKFERAWLNLLTNAIEAAKSTVSLNYEIRGSDLYLRVTDDGPGIAREVRASLFQRGITAGKEFCPSTPFDEILRRGRTRLGLK